ncbi:hypothetical protein K1719_015983 [Acacia pycnantha]|nr:hypothetical protein K1719_015983 [Acacia pycnantha]
MSCNTFMKAKTSSLSFQWETLALSARRLSLCVFAFSLTIRSHSTICDCDLPLLHFSEVEVRSKGRSCRLSVGSHFDKRTRSPNQLQVLNLRFDLATPTKQWLLLLLLPGSHVDESLVRGEEMSSSLVNAIEGSMIALVIFSKGYASSRWCLEELVKIMEYKDAGQQIVIPVFYLVDPSDIRHQKRTYAEAFTLHEEKFKGSMDNFLYDNSK